MPMKGGITTNSLISTPATSEHHVCCKHNQSSSYHDLPCVKTYTHSWYSPNMLLCSSYRMICFWWPLRVPVLYVANDIVTTVPTEATTSTGKTFLGTDELLFCLHSALSDQGMFFFRKFNNTWLIIANLQGIILLI